jgi:hypothetical protein
LRANVRLGLNSLTVTNTLAYYYTRLIMVVKMTVVQAPGARTIKLFTRVLTYRNKLECLSLLP